MNSIKNIINNAISSRGEGKSILIFHENEADYLRGFADLHNHKFYLCPTEKSPQWDNSPLPHNFIITRSIAHINDLDLIICCNRGEAFDKAKKLSLNQHVPLVVIDFCGVGSLTPHPFSSSLVEKNPSHYAAKNADVYVAIHESIEKSWLPSNDGMSITIPSIAQANPPKVENTKHDKYQIAIEPFPRPYFDSLNLRVAPNTELTTDMSGADIFLNLWTSVTPPVLQAITLGIPVVTMQTEDEYIKYLSERQCCIVINQIQDISGQDFVNEVLSLHAQHDMKRKAKEETFCVPTQFASDWNSIIDYSTNKCYIRN